MVGAQSMSIEQEVVVIAVVAAVAVAAVAAVAVAVVAVSFCSSLGHRVCSCSRCRTKQQHKK